MNSQLRLSRRQMLQLATASGLTVLFSRLDGLYSKGLLEGDTFDIGKIGPFTPDMGDVAKREFFGDDFKRVHPYIWKPEDVLKNPPHKKEKHKIVIVGGGLGGLFAAYQLRDLKPVVLEQAPRFGGNAKGQTWRDTRYCMGSAYMTVPAEGSVVEKIFRDIGLEKFYKFKKGHEPVSVDNNLIADYWTTIIKRLPQMDEIDELVEDFNLGRNGRAYPEISGDSKITKAIKKLDSMTFKDFLEGELGKIHPELLAQLDFYCVGAFNATSDEVSAAAALNFYCAEGAMVVLPGGNGLLAEQLIKNMRPTIGDKNLRAGEIVLRVEVKGGGVTVHSFCPETQKLTLLEAEAVVMACPKFVVGRILKNIEQERLEAINQYKYRSYIVANMLVNKKIDPTFYEILMVKSTDLKTKMDGKHLRRATDIVHASFGMAGTDHTVISMYRPMAYDGGRQELYESGAYEKFRKEFENQIRNDVLPVLKINSNELVDIRLAHWGHAIPIAQPGLLSGNVCQKVRAPHRDRVFFVEQDNWALPAMETSASEAIYWEPFVREVVSPKKS